MSGYYGYIVNCPCEFCDEERAREVADKAAAERAAAETKEVHPVPTSRLLTREMVLKGSPCYEYRSRFILRYGVNGVMVSVEKALSESNDWDWEWAGASLLSRKATAEFSRRSREADKAYDDTMKPYWDLVNNVYNKYYEVRDTASREGRRMGLSYEERYELMDKASEGILTVPRAAWDAANEIAAKLRRDARVTAFAELFVGDGPAYEEEHKDDDPFVEYNDEDDEENEDY